MKMTLRQMKCKTPSQGEELWKLNYFNALI